MNAADLATTVTAVAPELPFILLPLVGLILARSKLLPRGGASVLATIGFALLLVHAVSQVGFQVYLLRDSARDHLQLIAAWAVGGRALSLAALICLSSAIFVGRAKKIERSGDTRP